jgi:hypothetical protein
MESFSESHFVPPLLVYYVEIDLSSLDSSNRTSSAELLSPNDNLDAPDDHVLVFATFD